MNVAWKKRVKQFICGLAMCMIAVLALPGMKSEAAAKKPTCVKKQTVYLANMERPEEYISDGDSDCYTTSISNHIFIKNLSSKAKITNIKSSNKRIKVTNGFNTKDVRRFKGLFVNANGCRPGDKSKVTFKVKQNGKTYSLSCTVTIKKASSVFKTLSIGGKNYAAKFNGYSERILKLPKNKKVKILVKLKPGMKLIDIIDTSTGKEIKNGQTVKLKKGDRLWINYRYTKKPTNYSGCINKNMKDMFLYDFAYIYVR